jgi:RHS repeat-associated protein
LSRFVTGNCEEAEADWISFDEEGKGASNRTWREVAPDGSNPTGFDEFYTYDNLQRLMRAARGTLSGTPYSGVTSPVKTQDFGLEALGNWKTFKEDDDATLDWDMLNQSRTHNPVNEMTGISQGQGQTQWIVPAYDLAGNMTSGPKPGAETTRIHMKYDAWNRMVAVYADNNGSPGNLIITARYDGLTRRIQKIVAGSPDVTYDYYYNEGKQVLEERKTVGQGSTQTYAQYIWDGRYVHSPACRFRDSDGNGSLDETLYYTNDANFNVTALLDASSGNVVERVVYDPYGKPTFYDGSWANPSSTSAYSNDVLYTGHRLDTETGLYHGGFRYYNYILGDWTSRGSDLYDYPNLYEYVGGSPTGWTDPSGLWVPDDHQRLTQESLKKAFPEPQKDSKTGKMKPDPLVNSACRAWIETTLDEADRSQDKSKGNRPDDPTDPFNDLRRHYNRPPNQSAADADAAYTGYLNQEKELFWAQLKPITHPCDTDTKRQACREAIKTLGRLMHSWQDYFAHAVQKNGDPNAWSLNITGTPDQLNPQLKASSWDWTTGEHGPTEPASRDAPYTGMGGRLRFEAARDFVASKLTDYIRPWLAKCKCCCPQ